MPCNADVRSVQPTVVSDRRRFADLRLLHLSEKAVNHESIRNFSRTSYEPARVGSPRSEFIGSIVVGRGSRVLRDCRALSDPARFGRGTRPFIDLCLVKRGCLFGEDWKRDDPLVDFRRDS